MIPLPISFQTSPGSSKRVKYWVSYDQNSESHLCYLLYTEILIYLDDPVLILTSNLTGSFTKTAMHMCRYQSNTGLLWVYTAFLHSQLNQSLPGFDFIVQDSYSFEIHSCESVWTWPYAVPSRFQIYAPHVLHISSLYVHVYQASFACEFYFNF